MATVRNEEFDILRALFIIIAIILHYDTRINLSFIGDPFVTFNKNFFNIGTFFFFTAGYMGYSIYLKRLENNGIKTAIRIIYKGLQILLIYIGFITFMRLATHSTIPHEPYSFLYEHHFFTKVLFMFSLIYILSPLLISGYMTHKSLFFIAAIFIYLGYIFSTHYPMNEELKGVFFGVGPKKGEYSLFSSLISYCIGFCLAIIDKKYLLTTRSLRLLGIASISCLAVHYCLINSFSSWMVIHSRPLYIIITSILPFLTLLIVRFILTSDIANKFVNRKSIKIIGVKTLTFYVVSNMILGFLNYSVKSDLPYKLIVLMSLFGITYVFTSWRFYSEFYLKSLSKG